MVTPQTAFQLRQGEKLVYEDSQPYVERLTVDNNIDIAGGTIASSKPISVSDINEEDCDACTIKRR